MRSDFFTNYLCYKSMKYRKCIILYIANYCEKIDSLLGVEHLLELNIDIEYWNISKLTVNQHLLPYESKGLKEIEVNTYTELKNLVCRNRQALFIPYMNYAFFSFRVYRILSKYNCSILYVVSGVFPSAKNNNWIKRLKNNLSLKKIGQFGVNRLLRLLLDTSLFVPADFVMLSCNRATVDYKVSDKTIFFPCRSNDYESFLRSFSKNERTEKPYIAFVDQYLPYHNDCVVLGNDLINPDTYYSLLNKFFLRVEQKYKCKVIVCAHPSALLYKEFNPFEGRKIVFSKTSQYIQNSRGVILHTSTAVSYAVLANKPILIYTTNDLNKSYSFTHEYTALLADLLNLSLVNLDDYDSFDFNGINQNKYQQYISDYLVYPTAEDRPNYELICSILDDTYLKFKL